jgi:hypothetical protein
MLSVTTGSSGASTAQASPNASLGKYVSTTAVNTGTPLNNLFPDISGSTNLAGQTDYRCVFVQNNNSTLTAQSVVVWLQSQVAGGADAQIALDNISATSKTSASAQADVIASTTTAPVSVGAFTSAASAAAGLSLGDLAPGQVRAIWIKRSISNAGAVNNDGFTLEIDFDSAA